MDQPRSIPAVEITDEVQVLLSAWRTAFRGMMADGWSPIDLSESMLAVAIRVKIELDGPAHVARMLALRVDELTGMAAVEGQAPSTGMH